MVISFRRRNYSNNMLSAFDLLPFVVWFFSENIRYSCIFTTVPQHWYGIGALNLYNGTDVENSGIFPFQHLMAEVTLQQQNTSLTNPTVHLYHMPQFIFQNRNIRISVLNSELWDMGRVRCGICKFGPLLFVWYFIMHLQKHERISLSGGYCQS